MTKKGTLTGFGDVSNNDTKDKVDNKKENSKVTITEVSTGIDVDFSTNSNTVDPIDDLLSSVARKPKKPAKKQIAVYIDEDVAKAFDKWADKHGKGAKSELINNFLKSALLKK